MASTWSHEAPHPDASHFRHHHQDGSVHDASWVGQYVYCSDRACRSQFYLTVPAAELPTTSVTEGDKVINYIDEAALNLQAA